VGIFVVENKEIIIIIIIRQFDIAPKYTRQMSMLSALEPGRLGIGSRVGCWWWGFLKDMLGVWCDKHCCKII
jgi:hypothetical protein